jgi:hypothetical protein
LGITRHFIGQELEGDEAAKFRVFGLVDDPHPSAAELLNDAVMRNSLADHWWARAFSDRFILRAQLRPVNESRAGMQLNL